jgi:hypothetical protein
MEWIQVVFSFVLAHWDQLFEVIGVAAVIATMTPNTSDDKVVSWVLASINAVGGNFGKSRNADS